MADEEVEEEYVPGSRSQMWIHEAHVEYLKDEYGDDVFKGKRPHDVIAIAFATRRDYRASEIYTDAKAAHETEVEEQKAAAAEEREARAAERAAAAEEKKAAKAEAKKGGGTTKAAAKKGGASTAKKATGTRTRKAAAEDDPFD